MADQYLRQRQLNHDISGSKSIAASDVTQTLFANPRAFDTLFIQRILVTILTDAAQTMTFQDSNGTPKVCAPVIGPNPGAATQWVFDFGSPGVPLTAGKDFVLSLSAAGLAANIQWEGYRRQTVTNNA